MRRVLELYCGIGGCAAALAPSAAGDVGVAAALDVNTAALAVYRRNFPAHRSEAATLEGFSASDLAAHDAHLWWLSPPCQPFTRRGLGRDADDPRARSLLHLVDRIAEVRPPALALENVPGFAGSRCHERLREVLDRAGYRVRETLLCPTELGIPNRRLRFYLAARLDGKPKPWGAEPPARGTEQGRGPAARLRDLVDRGLDPDPPGELRVEPALARRYQGALDIVDPDDPEAVTACFTSAYGRSHVRSGSYLLLPGGALRRFAPQEILRLLGFPDSFTLPPDLPAPRAWPLVGNSLSVPAVRRVLATVL